MNEAPRENDKQASLIEIGIVVVDMLDEVDQQALQLAHNRLTQWLQTHYAQFQWQITFLRREETKTAAQQEPSALMIEGSAVRDAEGWDFAFLITANELSARYKPYALAASSSALDLAVISTKRIDPQPYAIDGENEQRCEILAQRLSTLLLHCLCHINGLKSSEEDNNLMYRPQSASNLDSMQTLDEQQEQSVLENLNDVADIRLEETKSAAHFSTLRFYAHSAWINRREIYSATLHARPWEFPLRLVRLSAAATSAMLVLKTTAEAWELAGQQAIATLTLFLLVVIALGTFFVIIKQRLFVRRLRQTLTEQIVITNITATLIVLLGMLTTAAALMLLNAGLSALLYPGSLVASWTGIELINWQHYLQANLLMTSLGLLIGALGASFEAQHHFRHIVFVDEEI